MRSVQLTIGVIAIIVFLADYIRTKYIVHLNKEKTKASIYQRSVRQTGMNLEEIIKRNKDKMDSDKYESALKAVENMKNGGKDE